MAGEIKIKKGDRYPPLESTLSEEGVGVINFEAPLKAVKVILRIKKAGGSAEEKNGTFVSEGKAGKVQYKWTKADTEGTGVLAVAGEYEYEWIIEWESGVLEHFPSNGKKTLEVIPLTVT